MRHEHRHYMQTIKKEFVPTEIESPNRTDAVLYDVIEYAYMWCQGCQTMTKIKVSQGDDND